MRTPSFDTWTTIFLFASIQGIFVAVVLFFTKKQNRFNNILMSLFIFLFSLTLFEYVLFWTNYQIYLPQFVAISSSFPFLFGVILYFYFRSVFESRQFNKSDLLHLIPWALFVIYMLPFYLSDSASKVEFLTGKAPMPLLFRWPKMISGFIPYSEWVKIGHMIIYFRIITMKYYSMSKTNHEVCTWFKWIMSLFLFFVLSYASYFILVNFSFFNDKWDYMISFSMMFFIYFIAWFGYLQPKVFSGFTVGESILNKERYKNSALDTESGGEILQKLNHAMRVEKLYRDSDLRLDKLAEVTGVTRHHLSQVINESIGCSFFEYINMLRIEEAKILLSTKSKRELNISEVAFQVGFNNKVSFNNMFKKITGLTPSEYRIQFQNAGGQSTIA